MAYIRRVDINAGGGLSSRDDPILGNVLEINDKYIFKLFIQFVTLLESDEELAVYLTSDNPKEREIAELVAEYKKSKK